MMKFNSALLKQRRKDAGLTLLGLAEKIGSGKSYVWQLENKNREPSGKIVCLISRALKTPMERFYWPHIEIEHCELYAREVSE